MRQRLNILLSCLLLISACAHAQEIIYDTAPLDIITKAGSAVHFTVEVAKTPEQEEHGFMFRESVPDLHGMIFTFTPPQLIRMWMKNTPSSLDMLFINEHGIIDQIEAKTTPESTNVIASKHKVIAVIEIAGGGSALHHIAIGDKIVYSGLQ